MNPTGESERQPVAELLLTAYVKDTMRLAEQVRLRIREEMDAHDLSQRELAAQLKWSQSRVAKLLKGRVQMGLDELEAFCMVLEMRPTEAVRDRGFEFSAELTPTELRFLERLRRLPRPVVDSLMLLLKVPETGEEGPRKKPPIPRGVKKP